MAVKFKNSININDQYTLPSTVGLTNQYLKVNDAATGELVFADLGEAAQVSTIAYEVRNETGVSIPKGSVVYISGGSGASGHVTIALSSATSEAGSSKTFGITAETIANNSTGDVVLEGLIEGLDTSSFTAGGTLWLGDTPGSIQSAPPPSTPSHAVFVGYAVRIHHNNGSMFVKIQNGYELEELHDVLVTSATDGQVLTWDAANGYWKNVDQLQPGQSVIYTDNFTGDDSTTIFTLSNDIDSENNTSVYFDGVYQSKSNYSLLTNQLTFAVAPPAAVDIEVVSIKNVTLAASVEGTGTANYVTKWTDGDTIGNSIIYDNGTNVGIGTSSLAEKLSVNGNIILNSLYKIWGNSNAGITSSYISLYNPVDGGIDLMANYTTSKITFGTAGSERMRIDSSGNVGIGTSSPSAKMHIYDGIGSATTLLKLQTNFNSPSGNKSIVWSDSASDVARISVDYTAPMSKMRFGSIYNSGYQTGDAMVIQGNGNVGIGTSTPGALLDVNGTIRLSQSGKVEGRDYPYNTNIGSDFNATTTSIKAGSTFKSEISLIGGDVGDRIEFKTNSTERMRIDSSGRVGIGLTSTNSVRLGITGNSGLPATSGTTQTGLLRLKASNNAALDMGADHVNAVGWMQVTDVVDLSNEYNLLLQPNGGNVGIGTSSSPSQKLDVNGNVNVVGTLYSNRASLIRNEASSVPLQLVNNQVGVSGGSVGLEFGYDIYGYRKGAILFQSSDGAARGSLIFATNDSTSSANATIADERMRITSSGNVGIKGTNTKLGWERTNDGSPNIAYLTKTQTISTNGEAKLHGYDGIIFTTAGSETERMRIDSSGRVGIGTTSPSAKFSVLEPTANTEYASMGSGGTVDRHLKFSGFVANGTNNVGHRLSARNAIALNVSDNDALYIDREGTIQTNVTKPYGSDTANLRLKLTSTGTNYSSGAFFNIVFGDETITNSYIGDIQVVQEDASASTSSSMRFLTNTGGGNSATVERMRIASNGNVGIGETSPHSFGSGQSGLTISDGTGGCIRLKNDAGTANFDIENGGGLGTNLNSVNSFPLRFSTNNTERMRIASNGNVGIGTASPSAKINVFGAGDGNDTVMKIQNSSYGSTNTSGENKLEFGWSNHIGAAISANKETVNRTGFKIYAEVGYNVPVEVIRITSFGDLHVDGDVIAYSTTISDKRLKDDVQTIDNALDKVSNLRGVTYTWNNGNRKGQKDLGLIAQEVEQVLPELVREKEMPMIDGGTYKTVDYEKLVGVLIEAVKELSDKVNELENKL